MLELESPIPQTSDKPPRAPVPDALQHDLNGVMPALAAYHSLASVEASPVYRQHKSQIERLINAVVRENFSRHATTHDSKFLRVVAWNIERGIKLEGIIEKLKTHRDLSSADVILMTELDCGMARSGNFYVAGEIARALKLNYVFAPSYLSLNKGSGLEARATGDNTHALHGNAVFSRLPLTDFNAIRLPNGKDKMRGREKRLGSQRAVVADVVYQTGVLRLVSLHLDAHSTQAHRARQMRIVLDNLNENLSSTPTLIGGDWNTSTYDSSRAAFAIIGFWRRVAMGVTHVVKNHYPHPDRWFERHLFQMLEREGFEYKTLNETGAGTLHYDINDKAQYENMREWVPQWCFRFIEQALRETNGRCSLKLDWFAGKGVKPANSPRAIGNLKDKTGAPLSDHDAITVDVAI